MLFKHVDPQSANAVASTTSRVPSGVGTIAVAAVVVIGSGVTSLVLADAVATVASGSGVGGSAWLAHAAMAAASTLAMHAAIPKRSSRDIGRELSDDFVFAESVGSWLRLRGAPLGWLLVCTC